MQKNILKEVVTIFPWKMLLIVFFFECILLIAEVAFNSFAFQIYGGSLLSSIGMSVGITFSLVILYHIFQKTLAFAKNSITKIAIPLGWILLLTAFFYVLGSFRNLYLESNGLEDRVPTVGFVIINWILLIAAGYVLSKGPSWSEIGMKYQHRKGVKELQYLNKLLSDIQKQLNTAETEERLLVSNRERILAHDQTISEWISGLLRKTLSDFFNENMTARSDQHSSFNTFDKEDFLSITSPLKLT